MLLFCVKLVGKLRQLKRRNWSGSYYVPTSCFLSLDLLSFYARVDHLKGLFFEVLDHLHLKVRVEEYIIFFCLCRCSLDTMWSSKTTKLWRLLWTMVMVLHKTVILIKTWKPLLKPKSKAAMVESIVDKLRHGLVEA